ncbi:hypothetical protein [Streptosporangium saharense]|uniref:HK97 gp10 family phage protein n=1 Tax=Streptosporangium saharense TaxID=1706840 RepID=A0A7W7QK61_9ACTN|nr:hypothetical protein [Streptosporangium saharense]MBB4915095.1 hypothetical protein [Streptosporangium saharense]
MSREGFKAKLSSTKLTAKAHQAAARGLRMGVEHVLQVSRTQVPLEEATLERSGAASVDDKQLRATISYETPYAVVQHENLTYKHAPGRKAKYLEDPARDEAQIVQRLIAAQIRRAL